MASECQKGHEKIHLGWCNMNRFDRLVQDTNKKPLILYFPVQDTIFDDDVKWAKKYFDNGCTVLEIGLANDNPVLDGKTVRDSMARVLSHSNTDKMFASIKKIREYCPENILQIMVYFRVIEEMGMDVFAQKCEDAGVDGVLSPDVPKEKMSVLDQALGAKEIYNLRFVPYHLTDEVIEDLRKNAKGYIFQQAVDGATGAQKTVSEQIRFNVRRIKESGVKTPVCAGFGISNADQVKEALHMGADGVIVGSATVSHIIAGDGENFIKSLGDACGNLG